MQQLFFVEVTDTYGGEANYCWVKRFAVKAKSFQGAISKVARETGLSFRVEGSWGDLARYNARHAAICAFVSQFEPEIEAHSYVKHL